METVIYGVLKEEKQRNIEMQEAYTKELESLRKGSISKKVISGKTYYYLKYRDGNKIKNDYLGKSDFDIDSVKKELEHRKYLQGVLKRLKTEYRQICTIVKE